MMMVLEGVDRRCGGDDWDEGIKNKSSWRGRGRCLYVGWWTLDGMLAAGVGVKL